MRQIAVIGLGRFGATIATTLTEEGMEVLAIDRDKDRIEEIKDYVTVAVTLDATDEKALRAVGVNEVDTAIVCIGRDIEANLLTTTLLKKMGIPDIFARAIDPLQKEILKFMDIKGILNIEEDMGRMIAKNLITIGIKRHITLASGHSLLEIEVPKAFVGKTLKELDLRKNFRINVISIKKKEAHIDEAGQRSFKDLIVDVPLAEDRLEEGDVMIVVGADENLKKITQE